MTETSPTPGGPGGPSDSSVIPPNAGPVPKKIGYARYTTEIDALKSQLNDLQSQLTEQEKTISSLETQNAILKKDNDQFTVENSLLKKDNDADELKAKLQALTSKLDAQALLVTDLLRKHNLSQNSLKQQLVDAQTTIEHLSKERDAINSKKSELELQLQNNVSLLDEKSKANDELQVLVSRISSKLMLHETPGVVVLTEDRSANIEGALIEEGLPSGNGSGGGNGVPSGSGRRVPISRKTRSNR